jgi:hypothetical protein
MSIKYTKWLQNIPNVDKKYQHLPLKNTPKITQFCFFLFENIQSGNPASKPIAGIQQEMFLIDP